MTSTQPTHHSRRNRRDVGIAVAALVAIGLVVGSTTVRSSAADHDQRPIDTTPHLTTTPSSPPPPARSAHLIVQDEIDRALAEREAPAPATDVDPRGFARPMPDPSARRPAYLIIQDEIDRALGELETGG